jgi:branched-chain amino acid transport system permease protein
MTVIIESLTAASFYVLFALGLSLAWGVGKVLNLAHGAVFTMSGLAVYLVCKDVSLPLPVLTVMAGLAGGVLTLLIDACFFRYIRLRGENRAQVELRQMVASLGMATALVSLAEIWSGLSPQPVPPAISTARVMTIFGVKTPLIDIEVIIVAVVLAGVVIWAVKASPFGRALRAVAFNPDASEILGINSQRVIGSTMFISGVFAGIAAALLSADSLIYNQQLGNNYLLKGFAIVVLGGVGSVSGTVLGAIALGFAETLTSTYISADWSTVVAFILIFLVLVARPQGMVSARSAIRH